ncbi:MAG: N-6 DNA methylase [Candidatus Sumerlaeota bacterium]|nr:N-6 DNA methylase [Candidatus Sumerlaeota bacterium]
MTVPYNQASLFADEILSPQESFNQIANKLVAATKALIQRSRTEEDLKIGFEKALAPLCKDIGISLRPQYEKSIFQGGRTDVIHGQVIIEYEAPSAFRSPAAIEHAFAQLVGYMQGEAAERKDTLYLQDPRLVGIGFDGETIFFVHYRGDKVDFKTELASKDFHRSGPYLFDIESARTLLTHLRALSRRLLSADSLEEVFGPYGALAPRMVSALTDALKNWERAPRVHTFLNEWKRLFGIVYGEQLTGHQIQEAQALRDLYKVDSDVGFQEMLFSVHTYFVLIMKFIAADLLMLSESAYKTSFCDDLTHSGKTNIIQQLSEIENGGVYARRGITNFLEGDFFRWYLDAFSPRLEESIREMARALAEFEPATGAIAPENLRDLLKKLYQYLVPREVRHKLGEYYTPDWLAELAITETGYDGNPAKRFLDPACGSGTFLVLAIQLARKYCRENRISSKAAVKHILSNIWGFDLNPLAVIAARTNYLFALGEFALDLQQIEIPIYLADAVLWPENNGRNGIWARFLKNAFAPLAAGKFDFVIGNPPWIRWAYLSPEYREATMPMWEEYGLFSLKGHAARLGGGEKDFSMLFLYACVDNYVKHKGLLGFLITQEVFKSKGAGEGFRRFRLREREPFRVLKAHDLASVQPFEGAANKTSLIIIRKGEETKYPVPYTVWMRKKGSGKIPMREHWKNAQALLEKKQLIAQPIGKATGSWRTYPKHEKDSPHIEGLNPYQARLGARVEPYGVFWLSIIQTLHNGNLVVRNMTERGKRKIPDIQETIEPDLVFPAVCGADVERWGAFPQAFILVSQDPSTRAPYPIEKMRTQWPRTYGYLTHFKDILLSRGSRTVRQLAERTAFYAMFAIGPYTFARYKVVWKRMTNDIHAAVISDAKTPFGWKKVIPTDTTSIFSTDSEQEAHYLCAVINSHAIRNFIKSYSAAGRGFGSPSIMAHIGIPLFSQNDKRHTRLAKLSMALHGLRERNELAKSPQEEADVDQIAASLFSS